MNNSKIVLHQFTPHWGLPNASPFCMKLETYLRMIGLPYEVVLEDTLDKAPKGKMPYIEDGDQKIGDSNLVIEYLITKYGDRTDGHLGPAERAISLAMRRLIEENLYWCSVYSYWIDDRYWPIVRETYFGSLPPILKQVIPGLLRKGIGKNLRGHGMGRHSANEIYEIGCRDLHALSDFLGDKQFFFGDRPTMLDASAHATLANLIQAPTNSPLNLKARELNNVVAYCDRMNTQFYPN